MGTEAQCDICKRDFSASPANIVECFVLEDWEEEPPPWREPDEYVFVCPACDRKYAHYRDDGI